MGAIVPSQRPKISEKRIAEILIERGVRDLANGRGGYEETGEFGIKIHRGSYRSPSSWGCQTIWPDQRKAFYEWVCGELRRHSASKIGGAVFPYVLLSRA